MKFEVYLLTVLLGFIAAVVVLAITQEKQCPCAEWKWEPPHSEYVYTYDLLSEEWRWKWVNVPGRWKCVRRFERLPEGGCGELGSNGYIQVKKDAPKPSK